VFLSLNLSAWLFFCGSFNRPETISGEIRPPLSPGAGGDLGTLLSRTALITGRGYNGDNGVRRIRGHGSLSLALLPWRIYGRRTEPAGAYFTSCSTQDIKRRERERERERERDVESERETHTETLRGCWACGARAHLVRVRGVVADVDLQGARLAERRGREAVQVLGGVHAPHPPPRLLLRPDQSQRTAR